MGEGHLLWKRPWGRRSQRSDDGAEQQPGTAEKAALETVETAFALMPGVTAVAVSLIGGLLLLRRRRSGGGRL